MWRYRKKSWKQSRHFVKWVLGVPGVSWQKSGDCHTVFCPCVIGHLKLSDSSRFHVYSRRQLKVFSAILRKEREKPDLLLTVLTCKNYRNHVFSSNQVACNGRTVSHLVPNVDFLWILNLTVGRTARQTDSCHPQICTPSNSESAGQQAEEGRKGSVRARSSNLGLCLNGRNPMTWVRLLPCRVCTSRKMKLGSQSSIWFRHSTTWCARHPGY